MRLGELLLREQVITQDGLEEALESQVIHGGRLGTNLVELGLLSEQELARALGRLHNVAFASGTMTPDPRALELVDVDFADDKDLLPMRIDQTRVSVACINPHDIGAMDEIGFRSGKRVVPVVIPEFRMHQLLRKHCNAFRTIRSIDMGVIRTSRTKAEKTTKQSATDLMSEDEFQSLYAKALSGDTVAENGADPAEPAPMLAPLRDEPAEEPVLEGVLVEEEVPAVAPPPPVAAPSPPPVTPAPPVAARPVPAAPPVAAPPVSAPPIAAAPPSAVPPPVAAAPKPPPRPLTFAQAQQALAKIADREDVAKTVLRFALGKWKRSLLLNVQGPLVTGWHGVGEGIRDKAVRRIGIALRGQSSFKLVCDTRSHFIGPMKRDAVTAVFYKMLGGDYPTTAVMLPLLLRGKVVHILYVDNGPGQLTPPDIGELLILGQSVARSYEALISQRKAAGA